MVGDGIYPVLTPEGNADYSQPLQLLAQNIGFVDPISGMQREFHSAQKLRHLPELSQ